MEFIKTSRGFINLAHVDIISGSPDDKLCIGIAGSSTGLWFQGDEAKTIYHFLNSAAILDATVDQDEATDEADAMFAEHQAMKEAHRRIYGE